MEPSKQIWFPAKRYGWGWGPPVAWQGWVIMIAWIIGTIIGAILLARPGLWIWYAAFLIVMISLITAICYWKGEKPRWRWGD